MTAQQQTYEIQPGNPIVIMRNPNITNFNGIQSYYKVEKMNEPGVKDYKYTRLNSPNIQDIVSIDGNTDIVYDVENFLIPQGTETLAQFVRYIPPSRFHKLCKGLQCFSKTNSSLGGRKTYHRIRKNRKNKKTKRTQRTQRRQKTIRRKIYRR